jgi:outer membrane biosynthesis protein TonB
MGVCMRNPLRGLPLLGLCICLPAFADLPSMQQPDGATAAPAHTCQELKAFKDQLHKAIDAALKYPHVLSLHPLVGVTSVTYDYANGSVDNVRITMFSGEADLDRIALAAVKNADYAAITPRIDDERIHDVVIIIYDNTGDPDNADAKKGKKAQDAAESRCST